ncbi:MAG: zinc-ribbon domain-containing protein [Vicinamibacterales bacterium]
MTCRTCGTQIADNALICYKCGAATTTPRTAAPTPRSRVSRTLVMGIVVLALALAAAVREVACGSLL